MRRRMRENCAKKLILFSISSINFFLFHKEDRVAEWLEFMAAKVKVAGSNLKLFFSRKRNFFLDFFA